MQFEYIFAIVHDTCTFQSTHLTPNDEILVNKRQRSYMLPRSFCVVLAYQKALAPGSRGLQRSPIPPSWAGGCPPPASPRGFLYIIHLHSGRTGFFIDAMHGPALHPPTSCWLVSVPDPLHCSSGLITSQM